jgi:hypothetical protein
MRETGKRKMWPHHMRINSLDELVFEPMTRWEILERRWRQFWDLPVRAGVVSRELKDE